MNLIPSIANYFGVSIDELFGYTNERTKRIEELVTRMLKHSITLRKPPE